MTISRERTNMPTATDVIFSSNNTRAEKARMLREYKLSERIIRLKLQIRRELTGARTATFPNEVSIIDLTQKNANQTQPLQQHKYGEVSDALLTDPWNDDIANDMLWGPQVVPLFQTLEKVNHPKTHLFPGDIFVKERKTALTFALLEHTTLRKSRDRIAFWVDASIINKVESGIAVVFRRSNNQEADLAWDKRGYKIRGMTKEVNGSNNVELIAISQAMVAAQEVAPSVLYGTSFHNFSVAIFSDSQGAISALREYGSKKKNRRSHLSLVESTIAQARLLQALGIRIELHWVPGHTKVPGNVLADRIARFAAKSDCEQNNTDLHDTNWFSKMDTYVMNWTSLIQDSRSGNNNPRNPTKGNTPIASDTRESGLCKRNEIMPL